jgi:hypothetical protein
MNSYDNPLLGFNNDGKKKEQEQEQENKRKISKKIL